MIRRTQVMHALREAALEEQENKEREERLQRMGYNLEELEKDNPYNQFLNEGEKE